MQKHVAEFQNRMPRKPDYITPLLSWKWGVYDAFVIGILIIGVLSNIH